MSAAKYRTEVVELPGHKLGWRLVDGTGTVVPLRPGRIVMKGRKDPIFERVVQSALAKMAERED